MTCDMKECVFWIFCILIFLFVLSVVINEPRAESFDNSDKLTKKELESLKKMAKAYSEGRLVLQSLRVTGEMVVDGPMHCKKNLTAREINSVRLSSNTIDGAIIKGENVRDNNGALVKRGQRIRISNNGMYQVWTIEKDE